MGLLEYGNSIYFEILKEQAAASQCTSAAERSYPAFEVRGGREETPHIGGQGSGWEELPRARGQGRQPRGDTPRPRSVAAGRRHPTSEVRGGWEKPPRARRHGPRP